MTTPSIDKKNPSEEPRLTNLVLMSMKARSIHRLTVPCLLTLTFLSGLAAAEDWPQWRGPRHDGSATTSDALSLGPDSTLAIAWKQPLGSGYSSLSIADGRVITMFADGDADWVGAFDAQTGKPLWRHRVDSRYVGHDGSHDGPLSTPAISGDRVVAVGARGQLVCLDARTGAEHWAVHLVDDYGVQKPDYGFSGSPIIHDGLVILGTGTGETPTLSAFDLETGEPRWRAGRDKLSSQTPILAELAQGVELIYAAKDRLASRDPATGELIWRYKHDGQGAPAGVVPIDELNLSFHPQRSETMSVKLDPEGIQGEPAAPGGAPSVSVAWRNEALGKSYSTPVYFRGHLFGYSGAFLTCVDATTGERRWKSRAPGDGFLIRVDDHLVTLTRKGELHLGPASPESYHSTASLQVLDTASWTSPSFAHDLIFVRGFEELVAVRITRDAKAKVASASDDDSSSSNEGRIAGSLMARLADDVAAAEDKAGVVERFFEQHGDSPILEGDRLAHIVYRGSEQDVALSGDMFLGAPWYFVKEQRSLHRIPDTDVFYYSLQLEPDARVHYQLSVDFADPIPDPRNSATVEVDRIGEMSVLAMPRFRPAVGLNREGALQGRIEEQLIRSHVLGRYITLKVYLPPGYDDSERKYPAVYFSDAKLALDRGNLAKAFDTNSAIGDPRIVVMIQETTWTEHVGTRRDAYTEVLTQEIVPKIDELYRTIASAEGRAAVGCGEGGIISLLTALAQPGVFSQVASLSGYAVPDVSAQIQDLARASEDHELVIYLDWGKYDLRTGEGNLDIPAENRRLAAVLAEHGFTVASREVPQGFGWAIWKHRVGRMLASLSRVPDF